MKVVLKHNLKVSRGILPAGVYDDASGEIPKEIMAEVEAGAAIVEIVKDDKKAPKPPEKPVAGETVNRTGEQPAKAVKTPEKMVEEVPKRMTETKAAPVVTETKAAGKKAPRHRKKGAE